MSGHFSFGVSTLAEGGSFLSWPHFNTARRVLTASAWKSLAIVTPFTVHLLSLPNLMRWPWIKLFGRSSVVSPSISFVYPLKPSSRSTIGFGVELLSSSFLDMVLPHCLIV